MINEEQLLTSVLSKIETGLQKQIFYDKEKLKNLKVKYPNDITNPFKILEQVLNSIDFTYLELNNKLILVELQQNTDNQRSQEIRIVKLTGTIRSSSDQQPIIGATIKISNIGTVTDTYGNYMLNIPTGIHKVEIDYLGWETQTQTIEVYENEVYDFELFENATELNEVVISARAKDANVASISMSSVAVKLNTVRELPTLLGEIDVFRIIQQVPGVTSVGEGTSGVNVRGSDVQENLVLLDGIPLFNGSHVFGFFSAVNGDMLEGFELIKAGMESSYGGRTSALLDMQMKTGDFNNWHSKIKLSNILTSAVADGPIIKDKVSLMIGGRLNYSDYLLETTQDPEISRSSANFRDYGMRLMFKIGKKSNVTFSNYLSYDQFKFATDTVYNYSNSLVGLNWDYSISQDLSLLTHVYTSSYINEIEGNTPFLAYNYNSSIRASGGKFQAIYKPNPSLEAKLGGEFVSYSINPDEIEPKSPDDKIDQIDVVDDQSREVAIFGSVYYKVNDNLTFSSGLRYTRFQKIGIGTEYIFEPNEVRSRNNIVNSVNFSNGDIIQEYESFEPRFSLVYRISRSSSIKTSYQKTAQFIHQLSNSVAPSPFAIWRVSNTNIRPRRTDQLTTGYFFNFANNHYETSIEGYYKKSQNNLDYKNLVDLINNEFIEADLIAVDGRSYGVEFFLRKHQGRFKGWFSYTYSRSEFKTDGEFVDEIVNENNYYFTHFDKPHILNSSVTLDLSRRWTFGFNFNYSSGRPVSYPTARYSINDVQLIRFSERNSFRIRDYHRLDFSITLKGNLKREQLFKSSWTFSLYNVYARNNAFSVFFGRRQPFDAPFTPYQLSIIAIPVPSITWNLHIN